MSFNAKTRTETVSMQMLQILSTSSVQLLLSSEVDCCVTLKLSRLQRNHMIITQNISFNSAYISVGSVSSWPVSAQRAC